MTKQIRPVIVVAVLMVSLVAFFGIQYMVKTYRFEEPFKEKVLAINGVQTVRLVEGAGATKIDLTLVVDADVQKVHEQIDALVEEMKKGKFVIEINNEDSPMMAEYYQQMHFSIFEGIASGKFTMMAAQLKTIASEVGLDEYSIQVDNNRVYLKLVDDGEVFVKVVPRSNEGVAYQNTLEGGESQW